MLCHMFRLWSKKHVVSHVSPGAEEACCVTCFACSRRSMLCHMFHLGLKIAAVSHVCSVLEEACCFPNKVPQKGSSTKFPQVHLSCLLVLRSDNLLFCFFVFIFCFLFCVVLCHMFPLELKSAVMSHDSSRWRSMWCCFLRSSVKKFLQEVPPH